MLMLAGHGQRGAMSGWADVLGSAVGGGIVALLVWLVFAQPCTTVGSMTVDCVKLGAVMYSLAEVAFWVPLICTGIGFLVHFTRGNG
jgi:hypothetical protein